MPEVFAYCGLDCAACPAYIATRDNDLEFMQKTLEKWRVEYESPDMTLDAVTCDGCTSAGRHGGYCSECPVRACGVEKGVDTCADCPEYACEKLTRFFGVAPQARQNMEALRARKGLN